jgi:hypothetical protein
MKTKILLLSIFGVAAAATFAHAAFVGTLPSVMELFVTPGKVMTGEISVSNPDTEPMKVSMEVQEGWAERTGSTGCPPKKWLKINPSKSFVLKPQEVKKVRYKIKLPRECPPESMAIIFFNVDSAATQGGPLNMQMRHGVSIYAMVRSSSDPEILIKNIKSSLSEKTVPSPLSFSITLANKDKIHIRPRSRVSVSREGKQLAEIELDFGYPLYPNNEYVYSGKTAAVDWVPGRYTASIATECGWTYEHGKVISKQLDFIITDLKEVQLVQ